MRRINVFLFLIILLFATPVLKGANENGKAINDADWEKAINRVDYTESYKEFEKDKPEKTTETEIKTKKPLNYDWSFLKYIFYAIVICLVIFLIIKIISNVNKNPDIKKQQISIDSIEEIEEKMHELNLEDLLLEAIKNKNFHIALRINFLIIIKQLSEKKLIAWAKEKTNWEYFSELKDNILKDGFKNIIFVFEPVWYGERSLNEEMFYQIQPVFDSFKEKLKSDE